MNTFESLLPLAHILGLALAIGAATVKLMLLLKSRTDHTFVSTFIAVSKPITRLILIGTGLLVLSGICWLLLGYPLTGLLIVKLVLVGLIIVLGATIDKVVEPTFIRLAPVSGQSASTEFTKIQNRYLLVETTATGLYYVIVVLWLLG